MAAPQYRVFVCTKRRSPNDPEGCCCNAGGMELYEAFCAEIERQGVSGRVSVRRSGCLDRCESGAVAMVYRPKRRWLNWLPTKVQVKLRRWLFPERYTYGRLAPSDAGDILESHLVDRTPLKRCQI
ncbi:MAG: (2Fe-2S) ferredoxin domain-containing protein [Alkalinema sp. RU_4_3]|nr:(2Fe-2S) ferredoxin domain-containing protein [Alkalinema sp. RU_4_3]